MPERRLFGILRVRPSRPVQPHTTTPLSSADPLSPDDRLRILLVEDTLDEALLIRTVLEDEIGAKVTLAQDGLRGCQLAENQQWDLVVTDLNIPGKDGMEVIRTSREASPQTPVLATTAYTRPDHVDQALRAGADDVLDKPLDRDDFVARVRTLTRDRREHLDAVESGDRPRPERTVLAVGALPGDVEVGCGGILLGHRAHRHRVGLLVLSAGGEEDDAGDRMAEARSAAEILGAELVLPESVRAEIPGVEEMMAAVARAVERFEPDTVYTPSSNDVRDSRLGAHQAALVEAEGVANHYCYQAATTTLDFHPTLFIDVAEYLPRKIELLEEYRSEPEFRPHLQPYLARASAQYWGRFLGYGEVEPLEVVRSEF